MSGESVSITIASSAHARRPTRRMRSARSKVSGAAEAEPKAELDERVGLLLAAVEGVGDAARRRGVRRRCFSTVSTARRTCSSTGRPNSAASCELGGEEARLALAVEPGDEVVEADLADRDQPRVVGVARERVAQRAEVGRRRRASVHIGWMPSA